MFNECLYQCAVSVKCRCIYKTLSGRLQKLKNKGKVQLGNLQS